MAKIIKLTVTNTGRPISINADHIVSYQDVTAGSVIVKLVNGDSWYVNELVGDIDKLIKED